MRLNKTKGSLVENKPIFGIKYIIILNIAFITLCILSWIIGPSILELLKNNGLDLIMPTDINTIIIALSTISISMFQIIIEKVNDRILGMSYKKIFFKDRIWKYSNFPNSSLILLEMLIVSNILNLFKENVYINILHCIILVITIYFSCRIFYLSLIVVIKKSKIYYAIKKKIINSMDDIDNNIISDIIEELPLLEKENKKCYNSYIYEEIGVLIHLIIAIKDNKNIDKHKKQVINIIRNKIIYDDREIEKLISNIERKGNIEFGEEKEIWENILVEIKEINTECKAS